MRKTKEKTTYFTSASYDLGLDLDDAIFRVAGLSDASGAGFGQRDHSWYFNSAQEASELARKLKKINNLSVSTGKF